MSWELHAAAVGGDARGIRKGLASGLDPNEKDEAGWTPLHHAAGHNRPHVIEPLVQGGANQNITDNRGQNPIHIAAAENSLAAARELLRCKPGNTIHYAHSGNLTPIMIAYARGNFRMARLLKKAGADERLRDVERAFIRRCIAKWWFFLVVKVAIVTCVVYYAAKWMGLFGK